MVEFDETHKKKKAYFFHFIFLFFLDLGKWGLVYFERLCPNLDHDESPEEGGGGTLIVL